MPSFEPSDLVLGAGPGLAPRRKFGRVRSLAVCLAVSAVVPPLALAQGADGGFVSLATVEVEALVVTEGGRPVPRVLVFAADAASGAIALSGSTDPQGRVVLRVPARAHKFGIVSPHFNIQRFEAVGDHGIKLIVRPWRRLVRGQRTFSCPGCVPYDLTETGSSLSLLRGTVRDETGHPLAGVSVIAYRAGSHEMLGQTLTDAAGVYLLPLRGGRLLVGAFAPALSVQTSRPRGDGVDFVLRVDAAPDAIAIESGGHVLSFRMDDSIDPEYVPPPKVAAWLAYVYGPNYNESLQHVAVNAGNWQPIPVRQGYGVPIAPTSVVKRYQPRMKYWWLHMLRTAPSPAKAARQNF